MREDDEQHPLVRRLPRYVVQLADVWLPPTSENDHRLATKREYMTLDEVGEIMGISRERVRQIETKALRKLRHPTRSKRLSEFV